MSIAQLSARTPPGELIVSVPSDVDYGDAAATLNKAAGRGVRIAGIVAAGDDAVLIGNRLNAPVPIVDEMPVEHIGRGDLLALEVAAMGASVGVLSDPVALAGALALQPNEVAVAAREFADARCGVLVVRQTLAQEQAPESWVEYLDYDRGESVRLPLLAELHELAARVAPGSVRALCLHDARRKAGVGEPSVDYSVRDIFAPDLLGLRSRTYVRRGSVGFERVPLSVLREVTDGPPASVRFAELIGRRVVVPLPEADAAALGACSTPILGAAAPLVAVCDLGGGTIDLIAPSVSITAAGAGELLTVSVANVLGITREIAERVKRHPSVRIETPRIAHYENGERAFLDASAAPDVVGRLCVIGKQGPWPFQSDLAPEEWRLLRLALKARTVGANIERCLALLKDTPSLLLLCGGAALDDELVRTLSDTLSERGIVVGRANVAGRLGPRSLWRSVWQWQPRGQHIEADLRRGCGRRFPTAGAPSYSEQSRWFQNASVIPRPQPLYKERPSGQGVAR